MSWNTGNDDTWNAGGDAGDSWGGGGDTGASATADTGGDAWGGGDDSGQPAAGNGSGGDNTCRHCGQEGHFARECPDKPAGGLTGECYNCGEVGHNKADCTNPKVERPFKGTCNVCGVEGHAARNCPTQPTSCKLCKKEGHKAIDCKERRAMDWTGIPELDAEHAWDSLVKSANDKDLDAFRTSLKAYARALGDVFNLKEVANTMREDKLPIYLIAFKQEVAPNMTIVDLLGNPDREFVLSFQYTEKPRRAKQATGWPQNPQENAERLASAGFVQDRGVPMCSNCGELGHVRKHCKQEVQERETTGPAVSCVYCHEDGHRARDCPKERVNPFACKNCKQEGHNAKDCPEPRSAENVECHKCNQMGHFSRDCPNVDERPPKTCRNCGSTEHMARECDQPRNPDTVTCRNCDKQGHFSRDCPEPKDWSKVKCSNCQQFGHTFKRCKEPAAEGDGNAGEDKEQAATSGGWNEDNNVSSAAGGEANWNTGGDSGGW